MKRIPRAYQRPGKKPVTLKPTIRTPLAAMNEIITAEETSREIFIDTIIDPDGVERPVIRARHPASASDILSALKIKNTECLFSKAEVKAAYLFGEDYLRSGADPKMTQNWSGAAKNDLSARARANLRTALKVLGEDSIAMLRLCQAQQTPKSENIPQLKQSLQKLYAHYAEMKRVKKSSALTH